jgi:hypothetical protein
VALVSGATCSIPLLAGEPLVGSDPSGRDNGEAWAELSKVDQDLSPVVHRISAPGGVEGSSRPSATSAAFLLVENTAGARPLRHARTAPSEKHSTKVERRVRAVRFRFSLRRTGGERPSLQRQSNLTSRPRAVIPASFDRCRTRRSEPRRHRRVPSCPQPMGTSFAGDKGPSATPDRWRRKGGRTRGRSLMSHHRQSYDRRRPASSCFTPSSASPKIPSPWPAPGRRPRP